MDSTSCLRACARKARHENAQKKMGEDKERGQFSSAPITEALYTRPNNLRNSGSAHRVRSCFDSWTASERCHDGAHPGFFSTNIEGRCCRK
jgi:hypothetical protein